MTSKPFSQRMARTGAGPGVARAGMAPALMAGLLWLMAGLSGGYWLLQTWGHTAWVPVPAVAPSVPQADVATVARALGASAASLNAQAGPAAQTRFRLWGMVEQPGQQGAALIAVDGQPPRPIRVGDTVSEGLVLQAIDRRVVRLGPNQGGPTTLELNLPAAPE